MKIELPGLPYETDALEPYFSGRTIEMHHRFYQNAYVEKLDKLISGTRFENSGLLTMISEAEGPIYYYAAQIWNHTFYFKSINPKREYVFNCLFTNAVHNSFKSFNGLRERFVESATSVIGYCWVWLIINEYGVLDIIQENDAENPMRKGMKPILTIDLCKHAYFLDYQNRRKDYINSFWNLINWEVVEKRFCYFFSLNGFKKISPKEQSYLP